MSIFKVYTKEKGIVETDNYDEINGLTLHREYVPAYIQYDDNGSVAYEIYVINGKRHREDGPAYIRYYSNGKIAYEVYYVYDKCHRLDGPAVIEYNMNGSIEREYYYINGYRYTKVNYNKELLKFKLQSL